MMKCHFLPIYLVIRELDDAYLGEGAGVKLGNLLPCWWDHRLEQAPGKQCCSSDQPSGHIPFALAIPPWSAA